MEIPTIAGSGKRNVFEEIQRAPLTPQQAQKYLDQAQVRSGVEAYNTLRALMMLLPQDTLYPLTMKDYGQIHSATKSSKRRRQRSKQYKNNSTRKMRTRLAVYYTARTVWFQRQIESIQEESQTSSGLRSVQWAVVSENKDKALEKFNQIYGG